MSCTFCYAMRRGAVSTLGGSLVRSLYYSRQPASLSDDLLPSAAVRCRQAVSLSVVFLVMASVLLSHGAKAQTPPLQPTISGVTGGNASVTLTWTSGGNGGSAITKWQYQQKTGSTWANDWTDICETSGDPTCPNKTSHTVSTLTNGTVYKFKVRAVNSVGDGAASLESDAVTAGAPPKPTTPTAESGWEQVRLTASITGNNGSAITRWEYSTDGTTWTTVPGTNTATSLSRIVTVSSATRGNSLAYYVRAVNSHGNGVASAASSAVTANVSTPVKPKTPTATVNGTSVTLVSSVWSEGSSSVTRWEYKEKVGTGQYGSWTAFTSSNTASLNHTVGSLTAGTKYTYKVRAVNASGDGAESDASSEVTTASAPPAPTGITVSPGNASVTLGWTSGGNGGSAITKWQYQQKTGSTWANDWTDICETANASTCPNKTSHTVSTLTNGTSYKFKVRAVNVAGDGIASSESDQVTAGVPPKPTLTVEAGWQKVRLTASITSNNGSAITKWESSTDGTTWTAVPGTNTATSLSGIVTVSNPSHLTPTSYYVRAVNSAGNGIASAVSSAVTANVTTPVKPKAPTASVSGTSVTLVSSVWSEGSSSVTRWEYKQKVGTGQYGSWTAFTSSNTASLNHTVSDLTASTKYTFKVRAVNTGGDGAESDASNEVTTASAPPAPTGITVSPGNASVTLGWTSGGNGGSAITKWEYIKKVGAGNWENIWTQICKTSDDATCPNKTSFAVSTLTNGTAYKFKVRAVNSVGNGAASSESASVTPGVPSKSTTPVLEKSLNKIRVKASVASNGGSAITKWEYSSNGTSGWTAFSGTNTGTSLSGTVTIPSNSNTLSYSYHVRAVNANGNGSASDVSNAVTPTAGAPPKPENPVASLASGNVRLTSSVWANGNGVGITRWEYKKKPSDGSWDPNWTQISSSNSTSLTHTVSTGLTSGKAYKFKVRAVNSNGNSAESEESNQVTIAGAPPAPTGITVSAGNASVTLGWTSGGNGGSAITKWEYQQKTGSTWANDWTQICRTSDDTTCPNKTSFTVSTLTNGMNYKFKVRAVNSVGNGTASSESSSVTPNPVAPPKPSSFSVDVAYRTIRLKASVSSNGGSSITKWKFRYKQQAWSSWTNFSNDTAGNTLEEVATWGQDFTIVWQVRAVNAQGDGAVSDEVSSTTGPKAAPPKPENPVASLASGNVSLTSSVWADGNGAGITRWEYKKKPSDGSWDPNWTQISSSNSTSLTHTVSTGLTSGKAYKFKVRAVNSNGNSAESEESNQVTIAGAPPAPTGITVSAGNASVTLGWTSGGNGGSAITKWEYQQKTGSTWANDWTQICRTSDDTTCPNKTSFTVSTLTNGMNYKFKVRAVNSVGNGTASSESSSVTPNPVAPPKPSSFSVDVAYRTIRLKASVSSNGGSSITKWKFRYKQQAWSSWTNFSNDTAGNTLEEVATWGQDFTIVWQVRAVNAQGDGAVSDEVSSTTGPKAAPPKPENPVASLASGNVSLTSSVWADGNGAGITRWEYKKKPSDGSWDPNWTQISSSNSTSLTHTVSTGLTSSKAYKFKVRAVNSNGNSAESEESNEVTMPSAPPAPTGITVSAGNASVTLGWTSGGNGGSAITKWEYQQKTGSTWANDWTQICKTSDDATCPNKTSFAVSTLTNGTAYKFKVRAVNSVGNGAASSESASVTPGVPSKSTTPVLEKSLNKIRVKASVASNGGSAITKWEYSSNGTSGWTAFSGTNTGTSLSGTVTIPSNSNTLSYSYHVRAVNANGNGSASDVSNAVTPTAGAPPKPENPVASLASGNVRLTSSVWADGNGVGITRWEYKKKPSDGSWDPNWTQISSSNSTSLTHTVSTGLTSGKAYKFKVRAVNSNGNSAESEESNQVTIAGAPPAPTGITVSAGNASVTLGWTSGGNGGSAITKWEYQQKTGSTWANDWTQICRTSDDTTCPNKTSFTVSTLTNGMNYKFKVRAVNSVGNGTASSESSSVTPNPVAPPKPSSFSVDVAYRTIRLKASVSSNGGSSITKWKFRYKQQAWSSWTNFSNDTAGNTLEEVATWGQDFTIVWQVRAVNAQGDGAVSDEVSSTTGPKAAPPKPENPVASLASGNVSLTSSVWADGNGAGITRWEYKKKPSDGSWDPNWTQISSSNSTSLTHTVSTGLTSGKAYKFKVRAVNSNGNSAESEESNQVTIAGAPPAPTGITVSAGNASVTLGWTSGGNGGSAITKWEYQQKTGSTWANDWTQICRTSDDTTCPNKTSFTVSTLTNGMNYKFKVRAVNSVGNGTASSESSSVTPNPVAPPKPSSFSVDVAYRTIRLKASVSSNGGSSITKWKFRYKQQAWSSWTNFSNDTAGNTLEEVATWGQDFTIVWQVRAVNAQGDGAVSDEVSSTTGPKAAPPKPENPVASLASGNVSLTSSVWADGNGAGITRWEYKKKPSDGSWDPNWTQISSSNSTSLTHTVSTGLTSSKAYKFKVRAVNSNGNSAESEESNEVTMPSAPPAPTGITVSAGNASVTLGWTSGGNGGSAITKWEYQQKTGSTWANDWTQICKTSDDATCPNKTSFAVSTLTNGTAYKFKVRAVNSVGNGAASSESASVTPGVPSKSTTPVLEKSLNKIRVKASVASNGGSAITKWEYSSNGTSGWTAFSGTNTGTSLSGTVTIPSNSNTLSYSYHVRAVNANGNGSASDVSNAVTPTAGAPPKPENPVASLASGNVRLTSSVWADGNGVGITRWEYKKKPSDGSWDPNWTQISSSNSTSLTHTVSTGLTSGKAYKFKVRAVNSNGNSAESEESNQVTIAGAPPAPTGITVSAGNASVTLGWTSGGNGGSAITKWEYQQKTGSTWANDWTQICRTSDDTTCPNKTSFTVSTLTNGMNYKFKVRAVNSVGNGTASSESSSVTPNPVAPPKPSSFSVDVAYRTIRLKASVSSNGGSSITKWKFRYKQQAWSSWTNFSNDTAGNTLEEVATWGQDFTIVWQVRAVNAQGDGAVSDEVSSTTGPKAAPPKPENPVASLASGNVSLTSSVWADGNGAGITRWEYKKKPSDGSWDPNWTQISSSNSTSLTHTVSTGLTSGKAYKFKVRAVNSNGNSAESEESNQITTPSAPPAPTGITVSAGNASVTLGWTSGGNGGQCDHEVGVHQKGRGWQLGKHLDAKSARRRVTLLARRRQVTR